MGWSGYGFDGIGISCSIRWQSGDTGNISYTILLLILAFVAPVIIICFAYMKIYQKVNSHNRSIFQNLRHVVLKEKANTEITMLTIHQGLSQFVMFKEGRIAKVGFIMASAFCLAWLPYAVVSMMAVRGSSSISPLAATIPAIIAKSSTCYFPIIYGITHTSFRREIMRMVRREQDTT